MNQKALNALEYPKIIEKLTDKASSYMGKQLCKNLEPSTDLEEIRLMQIQTKDALTRLFQKGSVSFGSVKRHTWFPETSGNRKFSRYSGNSCYLRSSGKYFQSQSIFT